MLTQHDFDNILEIRSFLQSLNVGFEEYDDTFTFTNALNECLNSKMKVFRFNEKQIEIRYVKSGDFPIDNSKWGAGFCGTPKDFFFKLSKKKHDEDIRTIFIKDYEMDEMTSFIDLNGDSISNYRRKWIVIQSTIAAIFGKLKYNIYARDCEVKVVRPHEASVFLQKYCFYGMRGATITLGLYLKKDIGELKKGTLVFLSSFGMNFYGNKNHKEDPFIEVIRVGTMTDTRVVGGASKLLTHFIRSYKTLTVTRKKEKVTFPVNRVVYYVDADHWDGQGMKTLGYELRGWDNFGFHNFAVDDISLPKLKVKKGQMFQRKPLIHKKIMELMQSHKVISIGTAGTITYDIYKGNLNE